MLLFVYQVCLSFRFVIILNSWIFWCLKFQKETTKLKISFHFYRNKSPENILIFVKWQNFRDLGMCYSCLYQTSSPHSFILYCTPLPGLKVFCRFLWTSKGIFCFGKTPHKFVNIESNKKTCIGKIRSLYISTLDVVSNIFSLNLLFTYINNKLSSFILSVGEAKSLST